MDTKTRAFAGLAVFGVIAAGLATSHALRADQAAAKGAITLAVRANTDNGDPVLDLKPADLQLRVNGKPRPIAGLTLVQFKNDATPASAANAASADQAPAPAATGGAPPPFSTNSGPAPVAAPSAAPSPDNGRYVIIAIDDESFGPGYEQPAREAAQQLVDSLSPRDRIGVMTVPHGAAGLAPTANRDAIKTAIARVNARAQSNESDDDVICRSNV